MSGTKTGLPCETCDKHTIMGVHSNVPATAQCIFDGETYHRYCNKVCINKVKLIIHDYDGDREYTA